MKKGLLGWCLAALSTLSFAAPNADDASRLVQQQADVVMSTLQSDTQRFEQNPEAFSALIGKEVLPYLDFQTMSRIALGRYWNDASDAQKNAFAEAFRDLLVRVYSRGWSKYVDSTVTVLGHSGIDKYERTDVRLRVNPRSGSPANIVFSLRYQNNQWLIYDVSFENVSIVLSYRNGFASDIEKMGLDGLINKVRSMDGNE
ncbi:ABC transporter substrate-binding protein [Suttonella sp. R2A3]|uniref:MlaC/ttg2D family ABC transporter substrate-binding protein n=1 Tax=Suttonella sp. R2A3 TaxID=2908648 RepID=UPI001F17FDED|nr:ABC transporter substrate-binding protein [Suttonella sp. R2A3]UJF24556.1 ABC transporter substrate-binding protein [Suttonella sp. R2A3]